MTCCAAINCSNRDVRENREKGMTFHKFPCHKPEQLEKWLNNMKRVEPTGKLWMPTKSTKLCSAHFTPECFDRTGQTTRLRADAVPTIFDFSKQRDKIASSRRVKALIRASVPLDMETPPSPSASETHEEAVTTEHCYATSHSPRKLKRISDDSDRIEKVLVEEEPVDGGASPRSSSTSSSYDACEAYRRSIHNLRATPQEDHIIQLSQNQNPQLFPGSNTAYTKPGAACVSYPDSVVTLPAFSHDRKRTHALSLLDRKLTRGKCFTKDKNSPHESMEDPSLHFGLLVPEQKYTTESTYALYGRYVAERLEKLRQQASEKTVMILQNKIDNLIHEALVEAMPDTVTLSKVT